MQRYGFKFLTNNKIDMDINTNPYMVNIVYGLSDNKKLSSNSIKTMAAISAAMGDNLIWNFLKPSILLLSLFLLIFHNICIVFTMFFLYNIYISFLRLYGFQYGKSKIDKKHTLFDEWYFKKMVFYLKYIKMFFMGFAITYLIVVIWRIV